MNNTKINELENSVNSTNLKENGCFETCFSQFDIAECFLCSFPITSQEALRINIFLKRIFLTKLFWNAYSINRFAQL